MNFTGLVSHGLSRVIGEHATRHVSRIYVSVWSWVCIIVVPVAVGAVLAMSQERPSVTAINAPQGQLPVIQTDPHSNPVYVPSPLSLGPNITKAQYSAYLVNEHGDVMYRYPKVLVDRPDESIDAGDLSFKIPSISPGSYYLKATVVYQLNPLVNADMKVELARIIVKE